jgi:predicted nucleotidyltransferase
VNFEPGAHLPDRVGLVQDLVKFVGVRVDVVTSGALKPRDDYIRDAAVDL